MSLVVLLMVVAVGLLSLSAVALRTGNTAAARDRAMSNARLAIVMAIGELQRATGPDQRVTVPAEQVDDAAPRALTGAWRGWRPTAAALATDKNGPDPEDANSPMFKGWLVSGNPANLQSPASPPAAGNPREPFLVGRGSLGGDASNSQLLGASAFLVPTQDNTSLGSYAWVALDEAAKARADLDPRPDGLAYGTTATSRQSALGAARRFGIEAIQRLNSLEWWKDQGQSSLVSLDTASLLKQGLDPGPLSNDLTVWSRGLLTDAARGGFKRDLSLMFEGTLPAEVGRNRLYDDPAVVSAPANPYWAQLQEYANLYRRLTAAGANYQVNAAVPSGYRPFRQSGAANAPVFEATPAAPRGYPLMPVVARIQMIFSLVARNAHGGWANSVPNAAGDPNRKYMLHMVYSPVVTLHNPYNTALQFNELRVNFKDIPIGFQFYRNGQAQTTGLAPLNQLYVGSDSSSAKAKTFKLNLKSSVSSTTAPPIVLQPGETKVFGSFLPPNWTWASESPGVGKDGDLMFDWRNDDKRTQGDGGGIAVAPGWDRGIGFDIDWLTPRGMIVSGIDEGLGVFSLTDRDNVDVAFAPMPSESAGGQFSCATSLTVSGRTYDAGIIQMKYGNQQNLTKALTDRYQKLRFPQRLERPWTWAEIYEADNTPMKDYKRMRPFAIFSFESKTTLESGSASRPGSIHPPTLINVMDWSREDPAIHGFEAALLPVVAAGAGNTGSIDIDPQNRGFHFTGHTALNGVRAATYYEVPALPLQSIAQLRHAGLGTAAGYLPFANYTVGESWAHPLLPANAVNIPRGPQGYSYLDHTWLANSALWDGCFFSTLQTYSGPGFGSQSLALKDLAASFLDGEKPLLNTRLTPHLPAGAKPADTVADLTDPAAGYLKAARYLWVEGPFNVNSTSLEAWQAFLSSLNKSDIDYLDPVTGSGTADDAQNPFARTRRPNERAVDTLPAGLGRRDARWRGFRALPDDQIEQLAREIVAEIKTRGPFLSLAEFVNRNPGGSTAEALKGTLQAAIDRTAVNREFDTLDSRVITSDEASADGFAFPDAMAGPNAAGAGAYLTQGDILTAAGSLVTVRSDTFRIRAYGEARDATGNTVLAKAWCEAVVQRTHEYLDPADPPETAYAALSREANKKFGRRYEVVSFRWLGPNEV